MHNLNLDIDLIEIDTFVNNKCKSNEEILSEIESEKNNTKPFKDSISEGADFDEIAKKILDVNKGKKYPNINVNE